MGLLNKTVKHACPACGKEHDLVFYARPAGVYLDTVPRIPIAQLMQRCVICTSCGLLYGIDMPVTTNAQAIVETPEYQKINQGEYRSELEKKFAILAEVYHYPWVPLYRAHHAYHSGDTNKRKQYLQQALALLRAMPSAISERYFSDEFNAISFRGPLFYSGREQEIDILRQLGQFDAALKLIRSISEEERDMGLDAFLTKEQQLIKQKNSDPK